MKKITFFVLGPMLIAGLWASPKHSEQDRTHPATVVDWDSKSPLADVWATAYETNQIETIDDCPVYKGKITSDKSDKYGKLSLAVPVKLSDYYVQYCRQDYGGRR